MELERHLADIGYATSTALLTCAGFSKAEIWSFLRTGRITALQRGAYYREAESLEQTFLREHIALVRSLPLPYGISDEAALVGWGLPLLRGGTQRFHLVPRPGTPPGAVNSRTTLYTPVEAPLVPLPPPYDDVLAVPPAVACCQVAIRRGLLHGVVAADAALHSGLFTLDDLHSASTQTGLVRNIRRAHQLPEIVDTKAESVAESIFRYEAALAGVLLESQVPIYDDRGLVGRVDFRDGMTIYEIDGAVKYEGANGKQALVAEKRREDRLRALGYRVERLMWPDLTPDGVRRALRRNRAA